MRFSCALLLLALLFCAAHTAIAAPSTWTGKGLMSTFTTVSGKFTAYGPLSTIAETNVDDELLTFWTGNATLAHGSLLGRTEDYDILEGEDFLGAFFENSDPGFGDEAIRSAIILGTIHRLAVVYEIDGLLVWVLSDEPDYGYDPLDINTDDVFEIERDIPRGEVSNLISYQGVAALVYQFNETHFAFALGADATLANDSIPTIVNYLPSDSISHDIRIFAQGDSGLGVLFIDTNGDVSLLYSEDPQTSWPDMAERVLDLGHAYSEEHSLSLAILSNGAPAFVATEDSVVVYFVRALNASDLSDGWSTPVRISGETDQDDTTLFHSAEAMYLFDEYPAVTWGDHSDSDLYYTIKYTRALDALGTEWADPVVVVAGEDQNRVDAISLCALQSGMPAVTLVQANVFPTKTQYMVPHRYWLDCLTGLDACDFQSCYNLSSAMEFCGTCDVTCDPTSIESCTLGVCICADGYTDCGDSSQCFNLTSDADHCGSCSAPCDPTSTQDVCVASSCPCLNANFARCSGNNLACEDLRTDAANCGECDGQCGVGVGTVASCVDSQCVCEANRLNCDDNQLDCEVDMLTDAQNCGACGVVCDAATAAECSGGECECSAGFGRCDGLDFNSTSCADLSSSALHCGACNATCDPSTTTGCEDGSCVCMSGLVPHDTDPLVCVEPTSPPPPPPPPSSPPPPPSSPPPPPSSPPPPPPPFSCPAGEGIVDDDSCESCEPLFAYSDGTGPCEPCASECQTCDPVSGECTGGDPRQWCDESLCVDCDVELNWPSGAPCTEPAFSLDCEAVIEAGPFVWHASFRLFFRCEEDRVFGPFTPFFQVALQNSRRATDSDGNELVRWDADSMEWVDACQGCGAGCQPLQGCQQGEYAVRSVRPPVDNHGNTPSSSPAQEPTIPGGSVTTGAQTGGDPNLSPDAQMEMDMQFPASAAESLLLTGGVLSLTSILVCVVSMLLV